MRIHVDTPRSERHPLWNKEQFLSDLSRLRSVLRVCDIYADEKNSRSALNYDVWRWQKTDSAFDQKVKAILTEEGTARPNAGRPPKDGGDKSWQDVYCAALVEFNGNEEKARLASDCPYSLSHLKDMADQRRSAYDEEFAKKVGNAWQIIASDFQGILFGMRHVVLNEAEDDPDELEKVYTKAKIVETKARIAQKAMEKIDRDRWGPQMNVSGRIEHRHQLQDRYRKPEEILAALAEDRKKFIENRVRLLKAGTETPSTLQDTPAREEAVIDAEVVEDGSEPLARDPADD